MLLYNIFYKYKQDIIVLNYYKLLKKINLNFRDALKIMSNWVFEKTPRMGGASGEAIINTLQALQLKK